MVAKIFDTEVMDHPGSKLRDCAFANERLPLTVGTNTAVGEISQKKVRMVTNWVQAMLVVEYGMFIAVIFYRGAWWVRLNGMMYLEVRDFEWAGEVLKGLCEKVRTGKIEEDGGVLKGVGKLSIG